MSLPAPAVGEIRAKRKAVCNSTFIFVSEIVLIGEEVVLPMYKQVAAGSNRLLTTWYRAKVRPPRTRPFVVAPFVYLRWPAPAENLLVNQYPKVGEADINANPLPKLKPTFPSTKKRLRLELADCGRFGFVIIFRRGRGVARGHGCTLCKTEACVENTDANDGEQQRVKWDLFFHRNRVL